MWGFCLFCGGGENLLPELRAEARQCLRATLESPTVGANSGGIVPPFYFMLKYINKLFTSKILC